MTTYVRKSEIDIREKLKELESIASVKAPIQKYVQFRLTSAFTTTNIGGDYYSGNGQVIKNNWEITPGIDTHGVVSLQSDHFRIDEPGVYRIDYNFIVYEGSNSAWDQFDVWIGDITTGSFVSLGQSFGQFQYNTGSTYETNTAPSRYVYAVARLEKGSKIQVGYGISNGCVNFSVRGRETLGGANGTRTNVMFTRIGD